jgi:TRAP-type C4-dicarboxylate transport system permease small subunit
MKDWRDWPGCIENIGGSDVPTIKCFEVVFSNILTAVVSLAVLALFVMLIVGGFKYLTSAGDQKAAASAKQTMTYAVVGIALMVLAFIIFRLIEYFTGVSVTNFYIPNQ